MRKTELRMKNPKRNRLINLSLLSLGIAGLIWVSYQEDSIFIFLHPISFFSILFFFIGFIRVIFQTITHKIKALKYDLLYLSLSLLLLIGLQIKDAELFKSDKVFEAILIDDLSDIELILRKNKSFETITNTIFGSNLIKGKYETRGDTILFIDKPYNNDFIPLKILIDKEQQRVWIKKLENGEFDRTEYFAGYFEIRYESIE